MPVAAARPRTSRRGSPSAHRSTDDQRVDSFSPNPVAVASDSSSDIASSSDETDSRLVPAAPNGKAVPAEVARMAKKLVRLALGSEHTRTPLRRSVINEKILEAAHRRAFKEVFATAQDILQRTVGMNMVELPSRSVSARPTAKKRRRGDAAPAANSNKAYILIPLLPNAFRQLDCLAPRGQTDLVYNALVVVVCSIVLLSGGTLHDTALLKHMRALHLTDRTPLVGNSAEDVLRTMVKHLYLERERDDDARALGANESAWVYSIGPRAKLEISEEEVADFIVSVYGARGTDDLRARALRALAQARADRENVSRSSRTTNETQVRASQFPSLDTINATKSLNKRSRRARQAALEHDDNDDDLARANNARDDDDIEDDDEENSDEDEDDSDESSSVEESEDEDNSQII
ncbi:MAGE family-domain-containing protein [Limtongia smithiae]|uniref:MAGE family-domain-containing protein n=1 Tax=Limtongia smithiae TaxID=1125753 RepID=UPI0034CFF846